MFYSRENTVGLVPVGNVCGKGENLSKTRDLAATLWTVVDFQTGDVSVAILMDASGDESYFRHLTAYLIACYVL